MCAPGRSPPSTAQDRRDSGKTVAQLSHAHRAFASTISASSATDLLSEPRERANTGLPRYSRRTRRVRSPAMTAVLAELEAMLQPLESSPAVIAACLIGSYARDSSQPDDYSDIDVVAIVDDDAGQRIGRALARLAREQNKGQKIELRTIRRSALERMVERRTVYGAHLARDARILFDREGSFAQFQAAFPLGEPVLETAEFLRTRFSLYESLAWCNGRYLFCLADLYAIGRSTAMLGLAQEGVFEFDRRQVFDRFAHRHQRYADDVQTLRELEPFYMYVRRGAGRERDLPFSPIDCHGEATTARDACRVLLAAVA